MILFPEFDLIRVRTHNLHNLWIMNRAYPAPNALTHSTWPLTHLSLLNYLFKTNGANQMSTTVILKWHNEDIKFDVLAHFVYGTHVALYIMPYVLTVTM